jgi:sortase (surface protein transpeptidase)
MIARPGDSAIGAERLESLAGGVRPAPPSRISIPAAGIDATVEPVDEHGGALTVPHIGTAGWFEGGPRPGEPGRAVLIGHLDTHEGPGLFARVPTLPAGTRITVLDRRGQEHRYNVVGGAQVRKDRFPATSVYGHADAPVLVLITCGGPFQPGRGYRDNVLLYARAA